MIYLSGPMAGYPDHNYPYFNEIAKRLRERGLSVLNPAELSKDPGYCPEDYLKRDIIEMLCHCDTIALMPDFHRSKGARIEKQVAEALGFTMLRLNKEGQIVDTFKWPGIYAENKD